VLYPSALADGVIDVVAFAVPDSTVTKESLMYKLSVGTVINVLTFIIILFVVKGFSYIAEMLFDEESETKYLYGLISVGSAFLRTATGGDERKKDGF
jgi:hypothetical protein